MYNFYKLNFKVLKNGFNYEHITWYTKSTDPKEFGLSAAKSMLQDSLMARERARYALILETKEVTTEAIFNEANQ